MKVYSYGLNDTTFDPSRFSLDGTLKFAFFKTQPSSFLAKKPAGKP
jgi:hypothetical protein